MTERRRSERPAPVDWAGYAAHWAALHGGYDPRKASGPVRGWLWGAYRTARVLALLRVSPNQVTAAGLVAAAAVPVLASSGRWPLLAAALVGLGAFADTVDGALAVVTGRASALGQVYDAVADRLTEAAWLLALWLSGAPGWLVAGCGAVSWLHEYVRARAAVAGMSGIGAVTLGERPTRVLLAAFGLGLGGVAGLVSGALAAGTVTVAAAVWALFGVLGLGQLAVAVRHGLR